MPATDKSAAVLKRKRGNQFTKVGYGAYAPLDALKARAMMLLEEGRSVRKVAALTGLSPATVGRVKKGEYKIPEHVIGALKETEGQKLTLAHHKLIDSVLEMPDDELQKVSLSQRIVGAAVLLDKRELIEGRPTSRVERAMSDKDLEAEIEILEKHLERLLRGTDIDLQIGASIDVEAIEEGEIDGENSDSGPLQIADDRSRS